MATKKMLKSIRDLVYKHAVSRTEENINSDFHLYNTASKTWFLICRDAARVGTPPDFNRRGQADDQRVWRSDPGTEEECRKQAHYEPDTDIWLHEVTNINKVVKMQEFFVIDSALSFPINGSIVIIEKVSAGEVESYEFPTCEEYLKDLYCRIEVLFVDTLNPNDSGFTLDLSSESNYGQDQRGSVRNSILQV
ncbi:hypothetical protein pipiens_012147 [Culex pipiens pipiens]|uniref:Ubiquitin carboxyl-terminal hydrolase 7 ICP0-binding domain-containing protein n=1 Tax=Culex pipiens pipiens TaxID=38569 RepID=A0ABD1D3I5_CULPP